MNAKPASTIRSLSLILLLSLATQASQASTLWRGIDAIRSLVGDQEPQTRGIRLDIPMVVDDARAVPVSISLDHPMTADSYIESIHLFATGNPTPEVLSVELSPRMAEPVVSTRVRLNQSQKVYALARANDGRVWLTSTDVRVTVSGCMVSSDRPGDGVMTNPRIGIPRNLQPGRLAEIRLLIDHPMDTGLLKDREGNTIPEKILENVEVTINNEPVFKARLHRAVSANPYLHFNLRTSAEGDNENLEVTWTDDSGKTVTQSRDFTVQ